MRETKYRMENLALYDYRRVEEHLSAMASRGWRLESVGPWLWKYRRAEPARVRYAVAYIQDASRFNPGPTERQQTLEELCGAVGWTKVTDWCQMQIFCSEAEDPVPLETEESLRLEAVHRSIRRYFLPAHLLLLAVFLFYSARFLRAVAKNPLRCLADNSALACLPLIVLMAAYLLWRILSYVLWYLRSRRSVAQGGPCAVPADSRAISWGFGAALVLALALQIPARLSNGQRGEALYLALYLPATSLLIALLHRTTTFLRQRKVSREINIVLTLAADVVLATVLIGGLYLLTHRTSAGLLQGDQYLYKDERWDVSPISLPLTVSDLTGETYEHIRREEAPSGSVLLPRREYLETVLKGEEELRIRYEITTPPGWMYDTALRYAPAPREETFSYRAARFSWRYTWDEIPAAPWGCERAYRERCNGELLNTVLLIFPDRLAEFYFSEALTEEQMALIGDRLRKH